MVTCKCRRLPYLNDTQLHVGYLFIGPLWPSSTPCDARHNTSDKHLTVYVAHWIMPVCEKITNCSNTWTLAVYHVDEAPITYVPCHPRPAPCVALSHGVARATAHHRRSSLFCLSHQRHDRPNSCVAIFSKIRTGKFESHPTATCMQSGNIK